jgi:hypothetical protein
VKTRWNPLVDNALENRARRTRFSKFVVQTARVAARACRSLLLVGALAVAGCSWKAPTPADYVPYEGPSDAWIIAIPNPVPAGRGPGKTIVNWHTGDGSPGQVYVSIGGGPEQLFSTNPSHQEATVNGKGEYEFRLYAGSDHASLLATTKVIRDQPSRGQIPRDRGHLRTRNAR